MFHIKQVRQLALWLPLLAFLSWGCAAKTVKSIPERKVGAYALSRQSSFLEPIPVESIPSFTDDLDRASLNQAIERSLQYLKVLRDSDVYYFGGRRYTVQAMKETLFAFRDIMQGPQTDGVKKKRIRETFDFFQSPGDNGKGRVIFTGYYEPVLNGSLKKTERYKYPIYRTPEDTVVIKPGNSDEKNRKGLLVGRASKGEIIPHYSRAEIDGDGAITGRNLEILWVDDFVDLFFLHIQGSGKILLPDGETMQVGFAQANGYPYRSIGNYLIEQGKLTKGELSMQGIKKFLRENPDEAPAVLNYNERYVFFRVVDGGPFGALNIPVTAGRTIASDLNHFPKGALALIRARKPVMARGTVASWLPFSRFVLNQDAGDAIKGPGRIDLFCGSGDEAEAVAGRLKETGELFFLMKK